MMIELDVAVGGGRTLHVYDTLGESGQPATVR
jgi:hypothetical protein